MYQVHYLVAVKEIVNEMPIDRFDNSSTAVFTGFIPELYVYIS